MDEIEVMRRIAKMRSQGQANADREMREREEGGGMTQAERGALAKIIGMAMRPGDEGYRAKRVPGADRGRFMGGGEGVAADRGPFTGSEGSMRRMPLERPRQFKNGGVVKKKAPKVSRAKKSRNGCVMAGRGGKYKGMS